MASSAKPTLIYTKHAETVLLERQIARDWVERTIADPEHAESEPDNLEVKRVYRAIPERDGRVLRVVYVAEGNTLRVVTAFFDRGRRT